MIIDLSAEIITEIIAETSTVIIDQVQPLVIRLIP